MNGTPMNVMEGRDKRLGQWSIGLLITLWSYREGSCIIMADRATENRICKNYSGKEAMWMTDQAEFVGIKCLEITFK